MRISSVIVDKSGNWEICNDWKKNPPTIKKKKKKKIRKRELQVSRSVRLLLVPREINVKILLEGGI